MRYELSPPDYWDALYMTPPEVPTDIMEVYIATVIAEPFGGSRPLRGPEYDELTALADRIALSTPAFPEML